MLKKCLWLSSTPSSPIPITPLLAPAPSVHPDELTFWYCSRDLLKAARASWKSTPGFLESSWLHSEAEKMCLPSFSCWLRVESFVYKEKMDNPKFYVQFSSQWFVKSLIPCFLQTKKKKKKNWNEHSQSKLLTQMLEMQLSVLFVLLPFDQTALVHVCCEIL